MNVFIAIEVLLTMGRDGVLASQPNAIYSRCTVERTKLTVLDNEKYNPPYDQERPFKRQKTEEHFETNEIFAQKSPNQIFQSDNETEASLTAIENEKPVRVNPEISNGSNRDVLSGDTERTSSEGIRLEEVWESSVKAVGSAQTNAKREQQGSDLNVQNLAKESGSTLITDVDGRQVIQRHSQAPPPLQPFIHLEQEDLDKHEQLSQYSARSPTTAIAERRDVTIESCPAQNTKTGNGSNDTTGIVPSQQTVAKDSTISFPLCTSCGNKRVFTTPRYGQTEILW